MRKCVVIGGSGFIGSAILEYLVKSGEDKVVSVDRSPHLRRIKGVEYRQADILDTASVERVVDGADEVYHLAGVLGTSELNESLMIRKAIQVNVLGFVNVVEACMEAGVGKLFYPSKPNVWLNTYSITKAASEQFAELFDQAQGKMDFIRLRYFNAYGPGQHTHPIRKSGPTFCLQARLGLPLSVFGRGKNVVDMVYSDDLGKWTVEVTRRGLHRQVYDFGRGVPLTVLEVANDVNEVAGNKAGVSHVPMREGETEDTVLVADLKELRKDLSYAGVELEFQDWMKTLEETYRYYAEIPESTAREVLSFHRLL